MEEGTQDGVLLLANESSRQSPAVHGRTMLDLHRLVKNLSIDKMQCAGTKHTGIPVKTLKKLLKKAGLKVSGKKATLTRRAKRAKLFGGGIGPAPKSKMGSLLAPGAAVLDPNRGAQLADQNRLYHAEQLRKATEDKLNSGKSSVYVTLGQNKVLPSKEAQDMYDFVKNQKILSSEQKQRLLEIIEINKQAKLASEEMIRDEFKRENGYDLDDVQEPNVLFDFLEDILVGNVRRRGGKKKRSRRS